MPLASIAEPELVLPRIAAAVGAAIEGARRPLDVLVEHFADTPTLLVLDNLEQVVGVAPDLDQLLAQLPRARDPRHEPHRASASGRARVPGRPAHGAGVLGRPGADRAARLAARRPAVRRSSPGRPLRLRPDRRQRGGRRGDLPAPRRSAARHRARGGPRPIAGTGGIARSARESPRRAGYRAGRSPRAPTHAARDRRVERRAARGRRAAHAGQLCRSSSKAGRSRRPPTSPGSPRIGRSTCSTRSPGTAS